MITIQGKARNDGIAIATAALVDARSGINAVSPALLQEGLNAIKRQLGPADYPEAVVACDTLAIGVSVRIPGVSAVGIAAQSEVDTPGLQVDLPCVIGLPDLLQSISHGDIIIVDGEKGVVYVDPDPQTLIRYQQLEDRRTSRSAVFVASEHIPARTQTGETVFVHALVCAESDLPQALDAGADALIVEYEAGGNLDLYAATLRAAAGKPTAFETHVAELDFLRAVMQYAAPLQVSVLLPLAEHDALAAELMAALETCATEAFLRDLDPPCVNNPG